MKKFFALFLLAAFCLPIAFAQAPDPAAKPAATENANAKKARAILQQMIQALGGQAYLAIQTLEQEGRSYTYEHGQPNSMGTPFWLYYKVPDKQRIELTKQRDVVYIYVGEKGFEKTYKGVAPMEPEQLQTYVRQHLHSLEYVLRVWLSDPTTALFYDGPAVAEQKPCDSVTLMNSKNDSVTIFINSENHLPVKKTFQWRDPTDNLKNDEAELFDNWRVEQGFPTPHTLLRAHNGETTNEHFLTTVKYNTQMPDSMFDVTATYDPYKLKDGKK
jgi:outer membrane lipoprotein-sorting protein